MAQSENNTVTEDELARLAKDILIGNLEQIAVQFLGLTKAEVSACRYNAKCATGTRQFCLDGDFLLSDAMEKSNTKGKLEEHIVRTTIQGF